MEMLRAHISVVYLSLGKRPAAFDQVCFLREGVLKSIHEDINQSVNERGFVLLTNIQKDVCMLNSNLVQIC